MSADFDPYGKLRPAKSVQPGWHLRADGGWFEVEIYAHTENFITGVKAVKFIVADGAFMDVLRSAHVMCRTAAEARKAAKDAALSGGEAR